MYVKKKKIINKLVLLGIFTEWDKSYSLKQGNFRSSKETLGQARKLRVKQGNFRSSKGNFGSSKETSGQAKETLGQARKL